MRDVIAGQIQIFDFLQTVNITKRFQPFVPDKLVFKFEGVAALGQLFLNQPRNILDFGFVAHWPFADGVTGPRLIAQRKPISL